MARSIQQNIASKVKKYLDDVLEKLSEREISNIRQAIEDLRNDQLNVFEWYYELEYLLKGRDGVIEAEIQYSMGTGIVVYDPVEIDEETILNTIRNADVKSAHYTANTMSKEKCSYHPTFKNKMYCCGSNCYPYDTEKIYL